MLRIPMTRLQDLTNEPKVKVDQVNQVIGMPKIIQVEKNGRLVPEVVFEETPIEKMNDGLRVDDFALENLLANGYQPHRMDVDSTSFEQIDHAVEGAEALSKAHTQINKTEVQPSEN